MTRTKTGTPLPRMIAHSQQQQAHIPEMTLKRFTRLHTESWNPNARLVFWDNKGRRHWQVTRLAAVLYNARLCVGKGYKTEVYGWHKTLQYKITEWETPEPVAS